MASSDTYFKSGQSGNPGGKPKGSKNYVTKLREQVLAALEEAGGEGGAQAYLLVAAREDRKTFLQLVGKLLPKHTELSGSENEPVNIIVQKVYKQPQEKS